MLVRSVAVLVAANVLNNRIAPRFAPLTSAVATGVLVAMARRSGVSWQEIGFTEGATGAKIGGALAAGVAVVYTTGIIVPRTRRCFHDDRGGSLSRSECFQQALFQVRTGPVRTEQVA